MIRFRAVLDACVLYSGSLRDFILRLAEAGLIVPFWSEEIQNEWIENLRRNRPDLKRENIERTRKEMDFHFPNAPIRGYESLIPTLQLPDINDRHVLAVAIRAQAECIVTFNLDDFPNTILQSYAIEALSPDEFVWRLIQKESNRVFRAVRFHRSELTRPPKTVEEYLETLEKQGLPKTVAFLREYESDV